MEIQLSRPEKKTLQALDSQIDRWKRCRPFGLAAAAIVTSVILGLAIDRLINHVDHDSTIMFAGFQLMLISSLYRLAEREIFYSALIKKLVDRDQQAVVVKA